jgi:RNA polymerase sigma-70 factor, ECF subfamily
LASSSAPQPSSSRTPEQADITGLLLAFSRGEPRALDELMPIVYGELRRIARHHIRREVTGHTLDTTGLVHEAYLRLVDGQRVEWRDRNHFFSTASRAMRRVLVDHARARQTAKRGAGETLLPLLDDVYLTDTQADHLLALDEALERLQAVNERRCRLVECRFFAGLSLQETADVLGISLASVKREWALARAWLNRELEARE